MATSVKGLTIEIGGDTTKLESALNKSRATAKSLNTELNFVNKALKLDPSNVELVAQKQTLLKTAISETKTKLEAMKQAQEQADNLMKEGVEVDQEEYRQLQREIAFTQAKLKDYEVELSNVKVNLVEVGNKITDFGNKTADVGNKLLPLSTAITALGTASAVMASNFEDAMAKVNTIADTTEVPLDDLQTSIMELSDQTGISSSEIAENVYNAISAGQKTGDAVNFVNNATKLAKAGFAESGDALDILTTIMNAYGLEAEKVTDVSDMLIQTQNLGKTTVADLASAMGKVIPTANSMNVGLDNLTASYTILTAKGIATAEATTYMNSMLNELGDSGTTVGGILKEKTGKSFQELMDDGASLGDVLGIIQQSSEESGTAFNELWGSAEAGKAGISLLSDGVDSFNTRLGEMNDSTGATDEAFGKLDTTSYEVQKTINELKNTAILLGQTILTMLQPIIAKCSEKVREFAEWFKSLSDEQKEAIVKIGLLVASLAPALIAFGKVTAIVGKIVSLIGTIKNALVGLQATLAVTGSSIGAIALPIVAIVAVIATLVLAFKHLWETNEDFRNKITEIWNGIKAKFEEFSQGIVDRLNALGFDFESLTDVLKALWEGLCSFLAPLFEGAFSNIATILGTVLDVLTGILDIFIGLFTGNWDQLWLGVQEVFSGIWEGIIGIFTTVGDTLMSLLDVICGWFGTTWSDTWNGIKQFFVDIWNGIVQFFTDTLNNIVTFFQTTWSNIVSFFTEGIPAFIENVRVWLEQLPYNLGVMIGTLIGKVIQFGIDMVTWIATNVPLFISNVITFISELPGKVWTWLVNVVTKVIEWRNQMVAKAIEIGKNFVTNVINFFKELPGKIWTWLVNAVNKIVQWRADLIQKGKEAITGMITAIVDGAKSIPGKMLEIGKNIVNGVWNGICDAKDAFVSNVKNFFGGIVDGAKSALGINSPSREMEEKVGEWIPPGVAKGITKKTGVVKSSITSMVKGVIDTAKTAVTDFGSVGYEVAYAGVPITTGAGGTVNNINNRVEIHADSVDEDHIDEICDEINKRLGDKY
ncbi:MAG: phage tail tape measure protein [Parabacteroides sp.]|nr:phage tail tape measure protein [Parabacteroides sp.]